MLLVIADDITLIHHIQSRSEPCLGHGALDQLVHHGAQVFTCHRLFIEHAAELHVVDGAVDVIDVADIGQQFVEYVTSLNICASCLCVFVVLRHDEVFAFVALLELIIFGEGLDVDTQWLVLLEEYIVSVFVTAFLWSRAERAVGNRRCFVIFLDGAFPLHVFLHILDDFGRVGRFRILPSEDKKVASGSGKRHIEQVEVVDEILQMLTVVVVGVDGVSEFLALQRHRHERQLIVRFWLAVGGEPQRVVVSFYVPVTVRDDDIVVFESFALVDGYQSDAVDVVAVDSF